MTMDQYRPICIVLAVGMLLFGSYMIYDVSTNPPPSGTLALLGGALLSSLGAFVGFLSWRRTDRFSRPRELDTNRSSRHRAAP